MSRKVLLICGVVSSLLYAAMNVFVAMQWSSYRSASQTVSELSAIGAPTRQLWIALGIPYALLMAAFGFGIRASAQQDRRLRILGNLMIAYGVLGLFWPVAPMHLRGTQFSLTDSLHIAFAMTTVALMVIAIGYGSMALGRRFRLYSFATLAALLTFGLLTSLGAPRISENLPTPWIGVWERINIGAFLLWVIVLAIALLRRSDWSPVPRLRP